MRVKAALAFLSVSFLTYGQLSTGTITGTATDPTGSPIPSVKVTVLQTDTNYESRVETNSEGIFRVQSLQPGLYRVTFEAAGFKRIVLSGLDLHTGDVMPVNAKLEIGVHGHHIAGVEIQAGD